MIVISWTPLDYILTNSLFPNKNTNLTNNNSCTSNSYIKRKEKYHLSYQVLFFSITPWPHVWNFEDASSSPGSHMLVPTEVGVLPGVILTGWTMTGVKDTGDQGVPYPLHLFWRYQVLFLSTGKLPIKLTKNLKFETFQIIYGNLPKLNYI